jgi:hypothetical protein
MLLRHCEEWRKEVWSWQGAPFQCGAPFGDRLRYHIMLSMAMFPQPYVESYPHKDCLSNLNNSYVKTRL